MKELIEKAENLILVVNGGIGRNIFATSVVRNLKKAYNDKNIIVVAGFADTFNNSPHIKRVYQFDKPIYLFEDFIQDNKSIVLDVEPYRHPDYVNNNMHVVEAWCDLLEIPCDNTVGEMFFTKSELEMAYLQVQKRKNKLVLIQHVGGMQPQTCDKDSQLASRNSMYRRSLPENVVDEVVNKLKSNGFDVGCVQLPNQYCPKNAERINFPPRAIIALMPYVHGVISIDSFIMHSAAVMNKKALVCWGGTSPLKLGYEMHMNLRKKNCPTPECHRPNSYLFDVQPNGFMWDCKYSDECMNYSADDILTGFQELYGKFDEGKVVTAELVNTCAEECLCKK
jgi:hypothetical protein